MTDFREQLMYIKFSPRPDKTAVETWRVYICLWREINW